MPMTATEICIAAKIRGVDSYGKYMNMIKWGLITHPPMSEIEALKVKPKSANDKARVDCPVVCYDKEGNYIAEYENARTAEIELNKKGGGIYRVCRGQARTAYGFQWRYKGDEPPKSIIKERLPSPVKVAERKGKICPVCGKTFEGNKLEKYCSRICAYEARRKQKAIYHKAWEQKKKAERR